MNRQMENLQHILELLAMKNIRIAPPADATFEEAMSFIVEELIEKVHTTEKEKKVLSDIISETSNQFQERILDLSLVRRFSEELDVFMDLDEFYRKLLDILVEELGAENCSIMIIDKSTNELVRQAGRSKDKKDFQPTNMERRIRIGEGIAGLVAQQGQAMLIPRVSEEPQFVPLADTPPTICSLLCIPFPSSGEVLGVINLSHPEANIFTENNKRILTMLANQIALNITNSSILKAEQEASKNNMAWAISSLIETNRRLKTVSEISNLISASLDLQETLNIILIKVVELLQAERASLLLIDEESNDLVVEVAIGKNTQNLPNTRLRSGESISGYVVQTGKPILVKDIETDSRIKRSNQPRYSTKSLISVPLLSKYRPIGVLNVSDKIDKRSFGDHDLELVGALASQITIAIQNAAMFEKKKQAVVELETLNDLSDKVQRAKNISSAMEIILDSIARITDYSFSLFYYWDPKKQEMTLTNFRGLSKEEAKSYNVRFGEDFGALLHENPARLAQEPEKCFAPLIALPKIKATRHKCLIPLLTEEKFFGLLFIGKDEGKEYSQHDLNFLRIIASQAAAVYERSLSFVSAAQLITLGEIMGSVMHDLKNPLTAIKGTIQLLKQREGDVALTHKGLEIMGNSVQHLDELIDGYFSLTGSHVAHYQAQNINNIVRKLYTTLKSRFHRHHINFKLELADNIPPTVMDSRQIYEALLNILVNALQAIGEGGEVRISTRFLEVPDERDWLEIVIKDSGPGIPEKYRGKIFQRFFTTKDNGTGLGLPIALQIVKAHLGTIEVASKSQEGTTFTIKLPIAQERPKTDFS